MSGASFTALGSNLCFCWNYLSRSLPPCCKLLPGFDEKHICAEIHRLSLSPHPPSAFSATPFCFVHLVVPSAVSPAHPASLPACEACTPSWSAAVRPCEACTPSWSAAVCRARLARPAGLPPCSVRGLHAQHALSARLCPQRLQGCARGAAGCVSPLCYAHPGKMGQRW